MPECTSFSWTRGRPQGPFDRVAEDLQASWVQQVGFFGMQACWWLPASATGSETQPLADSKPSLSALADMGPLSGANHASLDAFLVTTTHCQQAIPAGMGSRVVGVEDCGNPDFRWITLKRIHVRRDGSWRGQHNRGPRRRSRRGLLSMHMAAALRAPSNPLHRCCTEPATEHSPLRARLEARSSWQRPWICAA